MPIARFWKMTAFAGCLLALVNLGATSAARGDGGDSTSQSQSKMALFDLIANQEHQYLGIGPFPEVKLNRWASKLEFLGVAPGHQDELKEVINSVFAPIIDQANGMNLDEFPGAELRDEDTNPNVLIFMGDNFASFEDKLPSGGHEIWQQLFEAMQRATSEMPDASCIHFVADDGARTVIAALIFVSTRSANDHRACAAHSLGEVFGLHGKALEDTSIISATHDFGTLRPLDRKALEVLYRRSGETNRSLSQAIDEVLAR